MALQEQLFRGVGQEYQAVDVLDGVGLSVGLTVQGKQNDEGQES